MIAMTMVVDCGCSDSDYSHFNGFNGSGYRLHILMLFMINDIWWHYNQIKNEIK